MWNARALVHHYDRRHAAKVAFFCKTAAAHDAIDLQDVHGDM